MATTNDDVVNQQIQQMISFIDQEADEKVQEIQAKADEEFEIEKGRIVTNKRKKVSSFYEKKTKQLHQQKKVKESQLINETRLKILKYQEEQIEQILNEARERLLQVHNDKDQYQSLMLGLLTQGLYQLLEDKVVIQCKESDVEMVEKMLETTEVSYKEATGKEVQLKINHKRFLNADTGGGVVMSNETGSIRVCNTLEARLDMIGQQMMPEIRRMLYGANPNRKFLD